MLLGMAAVFVLVGALVLILGIAVAVVVAATAESRRAAQSLPGGQWMSRQAERLTEQAYPRNAHEGFGFLSTPERDRRAERWFERIEGRIVAVLSLSPRRRAETVGERHDKRVLHASIARHRR